MIPRLLLLAVCLMAACAGTRDVDVYPFYRSRETLGGDGRDVVVMYPFYERQETKTSRDVWLRPFYQRRETEKETTTNVLLFLYKSRENETFRTVQIFPFYYYTERKTPEDMKNWFAIWFPFVIVGSDDFLIFPFGGTSHGFLGYDEFTLITPFYLRTRLKDFKATTILWPLISWGSDGKENGRRRLRIAPFYGKNRARDGTESGFVMWPFYTYTRNENSSSVFSFPFYGRIKTPTQSKTTIMWPFFNIERNYLTGEKTTAFWPFWQRSHGSDAVDIQRFWPVYEDRRTGFTTTRVVVWPFWRRTYVDDGVTFGSHTWFVPFYQHHRYVNPKDGSIKKKTLVWPIGFWETREDGSKIAQIPKLSPFEGLSLREAQETVRPFITLYRRVTRPNGDRDTTYLLGLVTARKRADSYYLKIPLVYSRRTTEEENRVRVLTGLFGWGKKDGRSYIRLLWGIKIGLGGGSK